MSAHPHERDEHRVTVEEIRQELLVRSVYACPGCIPSLTVHVTAAARSVTVHHSASCEEFARWLFHGVGPPPGTALPPHEPHEEGDTPA